MGIPQLETCGMISAQCRDRNPPGGPIVQCMHGFYARTGPDWFLSAGRRFGDRMRQSRIREDRTMRLTIEIAAAAFLLFCITASSAAFAAGPTGRSADGLSCAFSAPPHPPP